MKLSSTIVFVLLLSSGIAITGCEKQSGDGGQLVAESKVSGSSFSVKDWGPVEASVGQNPNPQPDGTLGVWVHIDGTREPGELQLTVDGVAARVTNFHEDRQLVTAAVDPGILKVAGAHKIALVKAGTGEVVPVGEILVK